MDYPIWNAGVGGGVLIGIVAIAHVIVSHFAVGGGIAIAAVETYAHRKGDGPLRELAKRSSLLLILISTVFGAISGVGIWVTIGLVHPVATSALIHNFVWGWAAEWGFFILEVVAALLYYATWEKVSARTHIAIGWLYAFAAYMSLVIIQGIVSFMLTPGRWLETRSFWDGIFNPTYAPGLVLRTGICLFLAGAFMSFAALREPDRSARARQVRLLAGLQAAGAVVAAAGYFFWEGALPASVHALFGGAKPIVPSLAATRTLLLGSLAAFLAVTLLTLLRPRLQSSTVAALLLVLASTSFGGYERLREGARKPFVIRDVMFSNGVLVEDIASLNERSFLAQARWAAHRAADTPEGRGQAVFRAQCSSCHTLDGYLAIRPIVGGIDADMLAGILMTLREEGAEYASGRYTEKGHFATHELDYPHMPPLVGTEEEMEALASYLQSLTPAQVAEVSHVR